MAHLASQAIVLQTSDYAEWDRLASLYTRDFGRIRGIAKGAKRSQKRFGSALEPFSHVDVFFVDKENHGLIRLERCRIIKMFPEIALDIKKITFGNYVLELINTLTPEKVKQTEIFDLLLFFITLLGQEDFREELLRIFEFRLFSLLGYQPQFLHCVGCGQEFSLQNRYKFSIKRGGIVCQGCYSQHTELLPLSNGTIRIFQQVQNFTLLKVKRIFFSPAEHEEGKILFDKFLQYHIGKKPKSLEILEQLT